MGGWGEGELAFSPDGKILAVAEDPCWSETGQKTQGCVRIWYLRPAETETTSTVLSGHQNEVRSVIFSRDGQTLASCSLDQTIRLWTSVNPAPILQCWTAVNWVSTSASVTFRVPRVARDITAATTESASLADRP